MFDLDKYIRNKLKENNLFLHEEFKPLAGVHKIYVISNDTDRQHSCSLSTKDFYDLPEAQATERFDYRLIQLKAVLDKGAKK